MLEQLNLGRLNPFARARNPAARPEVLHTPIQPRPEPLESIAQPLEQKTGEKFSERHLWRAWESVQHVAVGVGTRQIVKSATNAVLGEAGGSATAGIMAFINTTGGVLRGKETAADVYKKRAYHIAGGSVSQWHEQEKQEEKKAAGKSWLSSIGSALKGGLSTAGKVFNVFENASTQVVYGVTRKREAVSKAVDTIAPNPSGRLEDSTTWQQIFTQRLNNISKPTTIQTPPSRRSTAHLKGVAKREAQQLEQLAGNLSYLTSFDHGKIDVYGNKGSDIHKVRADLTPEVIKAMREGLQRAVTAHVGTATDGNKVFSRIEKRVYNGDEKHKGRTIVVGLLNAAAAAVKVVGVGKIVDMFNGHETVSETSQADLSGQYKPIQVPPEQVAQVAGRHITDNQDVVRAYELNDRFDTPHDYVSDTARVADSATESITTAHLPSIDAIKSVSHDGTIFSGARDLASQVHQSDNSILSNWPKSLNITNIAGNEQSILTNGLQKWMSLTGNGLDFEHAQRLSALIAEAHRQTAVLEAARGTWKDLSPELKTAFMLSEGMANKVSEDEALKILGLK